MTEMNGASIADSVMTVMGGVRGGPNGPIFPPCADGEAEMCLYENAILEAIESENS